ncbi:hypothetical protein B0T14DRAFT_517597 [Immersiella caudata]|uniref:Uncharacterized protein n=1 Tax=Immersiella caudata TaxID=314043 RepID=A0AA40C3Y0_9PEZI|nr:hypothetical protein B0T14DRAFT_517597 [Immersiella caudata]
MKDVNSLYVEPASAEAATTAQLQRFLHPNTLVQLLKSLSDVRKLMWGIDMPPRRLAEDRLKLRDSLIGVLDTLVSKFPNLGYLDLRCEDDDPFNHDFTLPNYIDPNSPGDKLSLAVHRLSQLRSLKTLILRTLSVSDQVFNGLTSEFATWQSLEHCTPTLSQTTPRGDWHFSRTPGAGLSLVKFQVPGDDFLAPPSQGPSGWRPSRLELADGVGERKWRRSLAPIPGDTRSCHIH